MNSLSQHPQQLITENETLREALAMLAVEVETLKGDKQVLEERLQYFLNRTFGRSTERLNPDQLRLFAAGALPTTAEQERETEEIQYKRKKPVKGHGREMFPDHLPRNVIEVEPPEDDRCCGECGDSLLRIRQEVTERGELIPARIVVNHYLRGVWACKKGCEGVKVAELPPGVIDKGKWEASAYAHVVVSKYGDHQPLHRQMSIFKRHGIRFPKSTMWDMAKRTAELLRPVSAQIRQELLQERILQADETPIQVVIPGQGKGKNSRTGYMWGYRGSGKIGFDFTTNRSRAGPTEYLGQWKGTLLADDYKGYDEICRRNGIRRAGCWAHARRKIKEALDLGDLRAKPALRAVQVMFRIERRIKARIARLELDGSAAFEKVAEFRQRFSKRVTSRLHEWLLAWLDDPRVLPKSKFGKAVRYLPRKPEQWAKFTVFLDDGAVPVDNNASERQVRPITLGRKNYQILGSVVGGDTAAILYGLIGSSKELDINPEQFIEDALRAIDTETDVSKLTPWAWKARKTAEAELNSPGE